MRYLLVFMLLVGIFVLGKNSCHFSGLGGVKGEGPLQSETRTVSDFKRIQLDIAGDVEVTTGDFSVQVSAQGNLLPLLKTVSENGTLKIYFEDNVSYSENILIKVSAPAFEAFSVSGSGEINCLSPIQAEHLDIAIGGSGDVAMTQSNINSLECSVSGSGGIVLGGKANSARIDISGSGEVEAKKLEINELRTAISGSGTITANVVQVLKASVSGSGDVFYLGDPTVESSVSGSGAIKKITQ